MNVLPAIRAVRQSHPGDMDEEALTQEVLAWYQREHGWTLNPHMIRADVQDALTCEQRSSMGAFPEDTQFYYPRENSR